METRMRKRGTHANQLAIAMINHGTLFESQVTNDHHTNIHKDHLSKTSFV